jgi:hypothetical protein
MEADQSAALICEMRERFERLEAMVAGLHPTDEADPGKAELIAELKRELEFDAGRDRAARTGR